MQTTGAGIERPVFAVGDRVFRWADIALTGMVAGAARELLAHGLLES
jgi:hypothetical protein